MAHKAEIKPKQAKVDGIDIMRPAYTISPAGSGCYHVIKNGLAIAKLRTKADAIKLINILKEVRSK